MVSPAALISISAALFPQAPTGIDDARLSLVRTHLLEGNLARCVGTVYNLLKDPSFSFY